MRFSIVIPIYNVDPVFFQKCMESVMDQDYKGEYEIILIDDGSTSNIGEICDEYQQKDSRISVVHRENKGVSETRNEGIRWARGEWLYFLDADDWIETNFLSSVEKTLKEQDLDVLFVSFQEDMEDVSLSHTYGWSGYHKLKNIEDIKLGLLDSSYCSFPCSFGTICSQIYRASFLREKKLYLLPELRRMEDTMFNLHTLDVTDRVGALNQIMYHYRKNPASVCNRCNPAIQDYILKFNDVLYQYIQGKSVAWSEAFEYKVTRNYYEILRLYFFHPQCDLTYQEKKLKWIDLKKNTTYAQYLGRNSYKNILKKSKRYGLVLFLTYNIQSFFLLECFWKVYHKNR